MLHTKLKETNEASNTKERESVSVKLRLHQKAADFAYASKAKDKEICKQDNSKKCFSFDLEQCLGSSEALYKHQLSTLNLTVYDNNTGQSTNSCDMKPWLVEGQTK